MSEHGVPLPDDALSTAFDLVEVHGVVAGGFAAAGRWTSSTTLDGTVKLIVMLRGRGELTVVDDTAVGRSVTLAAGDIAVVNARGELTLRGGTPDGPVREVEPDHWYPGTPLGTHYDEQSSDVVVAGHLQLNDAGRDLLDVLGPIGHVRADDPAARALRGHLDHLVEEMAEPRPGHGSAVRLRSQALLLDVLRTHVGQVELPPSWLRVLTDRQLRSVLACMHAQPGRHWRLSELAQAGLMSRTALTERFREVAGEPPMAYLRRLRILLARRALRDRDTRVGALAAELGYSSEAAFSTAFTRAVGEPPSRYRARRRGGRP